MSAEDRARLTEAIRAQNPDIETAWRTIAWWQETCAYWYDEAQKGYAARDSGLAAAVRELADEWECGLGDGGPCTELVGTTFPNGGDWLEEMACFSCRIRNLLDAYHSDALRRRDAEVRAAALREAADAAERDAAHCPEGCHTDTCRRHNMTTAHWLRARAAAEDGGQPHEELLTPDEWCSRLGARIADPDGWRDGTRAWDEPITREEFDRRLLVCTIDATGYPDFRQIGGRQ